MEKPCEVCVAAGDAGASRQFRVDEASLDGIHPSFGHRGAHQDVSEAVEDQLGFPGEGVVGGGDQCVLLEGARMDILSQAFLVSIYILSVGGKFLEIGDKDSCEVVFAIGCQSQFRDVDYRRLEKRREAEADGQCQFQVFLVVIMVWFS